jgi:hypothetical protein
MLRALPVLIASALLLAGAACDPGFPRAGPEATISEDEFVAAMVELRRGALHREGNRLPISERDRILAARGLTPDDLLHFAEVHGADVPYMYEVWTRVEAGLLGRDPEELEGAEDPLEVLEGLPEGETYTPDPPPPG